PPSIPCPSRVGDFSLFSLLLFKCLSSRLWGRPYYTRAWQGDRSYSRGDPCGQYISLKPKRGKKKTRKLPSGILPESTKQKTRSFRCTDYAKWKSMTRCVNR